MTHSKREGLVPLGPCLQNIQPQEDFFEHRVHALLGGAGSCELRPRLLLWLRWELAPWQ